MVPDGYVLVRVAELAMLRENSAVLIQVFAEAIRRRDYACVGRLRVDYGVSDGLDLRKS